MEEIGHRIWIVELLAMAMAGIALGYYLRANFKKPKIERHWNKMKNRLKKISSMFAAIAMLALLTVVRAGAQEITNPPPPVIEGPAWSLIQFLGTGSNWMVAPYGIYSAAGVNHKATVGGGLGFGFKVNDFVVPTMRLDYLDSQLWMPSASLQLQAPLRLFGKVDLIPFGFGGIATPVAGKGVDNGSAVGIYGLGAAVRLDFLGSWASRLDLIGDYEKWTGFEKGQVRFGVVYKF